MVRSTDDRRAVSRRLLASAVAGLAAAAVVAVPSRAHALPNPFVVLFATDLLIQLVVLCLVLVPLAWSSIRLATLRLVPTRAARFCVVAAIVASCTAALAALAPAPAAFEVVSAPLDTRLAECRPLSSDLARELDAPVGSVLIDPRPAPSFAAYHLKGSCNFTVAEILHDERVRRLVHGAAGGAFLVDDTELPTERLRTEDAEPPEQLVPLRGGIQARYKRGDAALGLGDPPTAVVDHTGEPVSASLGPFWSMGRYASPMAGHDAWRELSPATIPWALDRGIPVVDLREEGPERASVALAPHEARLETLRERSSGALRAAVFLCHDPPSCLGAESLALEMREAGLEPLGFVRLHGPIEGLAHVGSSSAAWALPFLLLLGAISVGVRGLLRRVLRGTRTGRSAASALAGVLVALSAWPLAAHLPAVGGGWEPWLSYLGDLRRMDMAWVAAVLPLIFLGAVWLCDAELGKPAWPWRVGMAVALFALLPLESQRQHPYGLHVLGVAALAATLGGQLLWDVFVARREARLARAAGRGPRVVSILAAAASPAAGPKLSRLAKASKAGIAIPPSCAVLAAPVSAAAAAEHLAAEVRTRLGAGPFVVRSSAPDEDEAGSLQAGRYRSITSVAPDALSLALRDVFADYVDQGRDAGEELAVLVQPEIRGRWAGVAIHEERGLGGGVLVEAERGVNFDVTAGVGASARDRIGRYSGRWALGAMAKGPSARRVVALVQHLELLFGGRVEIEWTWRRASPMLLQVRPAPAGPTEFSNEHAAALESIRGLRWLRGRARRAVLEVGELAEYQDAVSRVTTALLTDLWGSRQHRRAASRLLRVPAVAAPADPPILRIHGRLYENRVPSRPMARAWTATVTRLVRLMLRWGLTSRLRRLAAAIEGARRDAEPSEPDRARPARELASEALRVRQALLDEAVAAMSVAALYQYGPRRLARDAAGGLGDPLHADLSAGVAPDALAERHPDRALPDLAIEKPRLGESRARRAPTRERPRDRVRTDAAEGLDPSRPGLALSHLRGRARVLLAARAAELRAFLVALGDALGRTDTFEWELSDLRALAEEGREPPLREAPSAAPRLPATYSLALLEMAAGDGLPPDADEPKGRPRPAWIGRRRPLEGTVTALEDLASPPAGETLIVVLREASPAAFSALPPECIALCETGTALCHAALIARQRGVTALLGMGAAARGLAPGARVRIELDGTVTPRSTGTPA